MESSKSFNVEDEAIFASIFTDDLADDKMKSPYFLPYISHLCGSDLDTLNKEPERLEEKKVSLLQQTRDLAFHNYKTFISTADCSKGIVKDFSVIEEKLDNMISTLPQLSDHGQSFLKQVSKIGNVRRCTSLTLQKNTELLEILEIPQLMNTCVRNQYYEDALELVFYVKRLSKKQHIAEIPVIAGIIDDVKNSTVLMLEQLLAQLKTSLQLPVCLKIIGYVRRLECFSEIELRFKFLQVRNSWFESKLPFLKEGKSHDESQVHDYLSQLLEVYRVNLFSIVTQYRAIFMDDTTFSSPFDYSYHLEESADGKPKSSAIFSSWITYRVSVFVKELKKYLPLIPSRLDSILRPVMYFGQSFSKVGADFRSLIANVFIETIEKILAEELKSTVNSFESLMMSHSLMASVSHNQSTSVTPSSTTKTPLPPVNLLQHQPLCVLVNGILSMLNQVRSCCPVSIAQWLFVNLSAAFSKAADILVTFHSAESAAFSKTEKKNFDSLCKSFIYTAIPHINDCLQVMFSNDNLNVAFGPSAFSSNVEKFPVISVECLIDRIKSISPSSIVQQQLVFSEDLEILNDATSKGDIPDSYLNSLLTDDITKSLTNEDCKEENNFEPVSDNLNKESQKLLDNLLEKSTNGNISDKESEQCLNESKSLNGEEQKKNNLSSTVSNEASSDQSKCDSMSTNKNKIDQSDSKNTTMPDENESKETRNNIVDSINKNIDAVSSKIISQTNDHPSKLEPLTTEIQTNKVDKNDNKIDSDTNKKENIIQESSIEKNFENNSKELKATGQTKEDQSLFQPNALLEKDVMYVSENNLIRNEKVNQLSEEDTSNSANLPTTQTQQEVSIEENVSKVDAKTSSKTVFNESELSSFNKVEIDKD